MSASEVFTEPTKPEASSARAATIDALEHMRLPEATRQVVFVSSNDWQDHIGTLELYEKKAGHWQAVDEQWPVDLGRNGMAWGKGLISNRGDEQSDKREGDGKAPAGLFNISSSFGYESAPPRGSLMPYWQATKQDFFVDDTTSPDYNHHVRLADNDNPGSHWHSFEKMKRDDERYELGLVVDHNTAPTITGRGSAIFMHVWKDPGAGTAGCTSMSEGNMIELLHWLKPSAHPVLMQMPRNAVANYRDWRLQSTRIGY